MAKDPTVSNVSIQKPAFEAGSLTLVPEDKLRQIARVAGIPGYLDKPLEELIAEMSGENSGDGSGG